VKAECFAAFASAFGCGVFSSVANKTSSALTVHHQRGNYLGQGLNLFFAGWRHVQVQVIEDGFAGIDPAHEFRKPRVVYFQGVTDKCSGSSIDGFVVYYRLSAALERITDGFVLVSY